MLFGQLNDDIFLVLGGTNRRLYEQAILTIYREFFRSELLFPSEAEVVSAIYSFLAADPSLWGEDEAPVQLDRLLPRGGRRVRRRRAGGVDGQSTASAISRSRHIYNRLVVTGWLEESHYGWKVTVDMPAGAMRLAEFLTSLSEGPVEQLGGLVVEVRSAVRAVREKPFENALGLNKAARDAAAFGRFLRSVLSALREIDRQVLNSDSLAKRLRHYFEDFVERVLLRDYSAIATTGHPYRHRHNILAALDELEDSEGDIASVAEAYLEAKLASSAVAARDLVNADLLGIRTVFDRIDRAFDAIQQHRSRLETKLRNVVRYAGRRGGYLKRSESIIGNLDRVLRSSPRRGLDISGIIEPRQLVLSPSLLARPRMARFAVIGDPLVLPAPDPLLQLRRRLELEYLERLTVTPAQVARFLERRVPPFGEAPASAMWIETVDDLLAFEAVRLSVAAGIGTTAESRFLKQFAGHFEFIAGTGADVDNDWVACPGFVVRRLGDDVTLDRPNAA